MRAAQIYERIVTATLWAVKLREAYERHEAEQQKVAARNGL